MPSYTQANRPLTCTTPLGKDVLLLVGFSGQEAISQLFQFHLDLVAEKKTTIDFGQLIGQPITVEVDVPQGGKRYFNGIVKRFSQGGRDDTFIHFRAEMVPQFWLWTKKAQSRIFQQLAVPDILKQVLAGLDVAFQIADTYQPRDYCVQYRESDFAFASRLMEEEGIRYFFQHTVQGHKMVVTDQPLNQPDLPPPNPVIFEEVLGGTRRTAASPIGKRRRNCVPGNTPSGTTVSS